MTNSGNHMVDGADKALSKGDKCPCGGAWEDVEICDLDDTECGPECPINEHASDCEHYTGKLRCKRCGEICEAK